MSPMHRSLVGTPLLCYCVKHQTRTVSLHAIMAHIVIVNNAHEHKYIMYMYTWYIDPLRERHGISYMFS